MLLALDACGDTPSAAIFINGRPSAISRLPLGHKHADELPALVEDLLSPIGADALDCLAVTIGPGSYTGIRACLAFVKGFALATKLPVFGMTAFTCLGEFIQCNQQDIVLIDAGRGRIWGRTALVEDASIAPIDSVLETWPDEARAIGSARILQDLPAGIETVPVELDACILGHVAWSRQQHQFPALTGSEILPLYLRSADAQLSAGKSLLDKMLKPPPQYQVD